MFASIGYRSNLVPIALCSPHHHLEFHLFAATSTPTPSTILNSYFHIVIIPKAHSQCSETSNPMLMTQQALELRQCIDSLATMIIEVQKQQEAFEDHMTSQFKHFKHKKMSLMCSLQ